MSATTTTGMTPVTKSQTDLVIVLLGTWLMLGLFLDGYAHTNILEELESFFTPWHAIFYSGFLATAGWIGWIVYRRIGPDRGFRQAIPPGYGLAVTGVALFSAGGIGDGIWHTALGIEAGIDALLSPTHLLLLLGALLIMTTPMRTARLRNQGGVLPRNERLGVILALTITTSALAFFFMYLWAPGQGWWAAQPFNGATGRGNEYVVIGMAAILLSNLILIAPLAATLRLWRPPPGLGTAIWVVVNGLVAAAFDLELGRALAVGAAGGLTADALIALLDAGPERRWSSITVLVGAPLAAWSVFFIALARAGELSWPPEIWGGAIVFASLSGLGLGLLSMPEPASG